jgi:surface polysaccharide O-acyltransferase-like enzyme
MARPDAPDDLSVASLVDATPASRQRYVDFLRAASIAVVVAWHWVFSITHWRGGVLTMPNPIGDVRGLWLLTWLLQVMPLFFFVGGYANLAAWEGVRRKGDGVVAFWQARLHRLLRPVAVFVAVWLVADVALWLTVDRWSGITHFGMITFVPLWFLGVYAAVVLLVPLTAAAHERARLLPAVALGAAVVLVDLGRFRFDLGEVAIVNGLLVFLFAHQLGYFWRDGTLLRTSRANQAALALAGLVALVVLTNIGVYPRSMVAVRGEAISNMYPTTAAIAALAVFQAGVAMLARPAVERWLQGRRPWSAVVAANAVAMTVFVWHMTAYLLAVGVFTAAGGELLADASATWWATRPVWVVLPGVFLAVLVAVFWRFERPRGGR